MKKILWVAFGLLLTASLSAQTPSGTKEKKEQNGKQIQNDSVTNVAGERIVTQPTHIEDGNGAITKEQGTDAVANATTGSNKPKQNAKQSNKGLTAGGEIVPQKKAKTRRLPLTANRHQIIENFVSSDRAGVPP